MILININRQHVNGKIINVMINLVLDYKHKNMDNVLLVIVFGIKQENYVMTRNVKIISMQWIVQIFPFVNGPNTFVLNKRMQR